MNWPGGVKTARFFLFSRLVVIPANAGIYSDWLNHKGLTTEHAEDTEKL